MTARNEIILKKKAQQLLAFFEKLPDYNHPPQIKNLKKRIENRYQCSLKLNLAIEQEKKILGTFSSELDHFEEYIQAALKKRILNFKREIKRLENEEIKLFSKYQKKEKENQNIVQTIVKSAAETQRFKNLSILIHSSCDALRKKPALKDIYLEKENHFLKNKSIESLITLEKSFTELRNKLQLQIKEWEVLNLNLEEQNRESSKEIYEILIKINNESKKKWFEKNNEAKISALLSLKKRLLECYETGDPITFKSIILAWKNEHTAIPDHLNNFISQLLIKYGNEFIAPDFIVHAERAIDHANSIIKKGSTQLDNNFLGDEYANALFAATINQVRPLSQRKRLFKLCNKHVDILENDINLAEKYSLGNCYELSLLVLDYLLRNSNVRAEMYNIIGGDHVFIVVGRKEFSDPKDPKTWGPNALICDPWSKLVYPAMDYKIFLKNFSYKKTGDREFNYVEDFNPSKHTLEPLLYKNTSYLRTHRDIKCLNRNFIASLTNIKNIILSHSIKLKTLTNQLEKKYKSDDNKVLKLRQKTAVLDEIINAIENEIKFHNNITSDDQSIYREKWNDYHIILNNHFKKAYNAIFFDNESKGILFTVRNKESISNKFRFFIGKRGKMETILQQEIQSTSETLKAISNIKIKR